MYPYLARQLLGFSTAGSKFVSIMRRARMVRSNTLHPVSSGRVPELGVLVVGVTSWSGEGIEPKSLEIGV
jgi:hypothetical protein